jgi:SAM-dependent methyltransferase
MKLSSIKINKSLLKDILVETWRGKNMDRLLLNNALRSIELSGDILDLGSGGTKASYHRFIKFIKSYKITHTDLYKNIDQPDILKINLEEKFNINNNNFDAVMCFNVLEHIYNYQNVIAETHRILKPGGIFVGSVPFLINYHADPNDYWRYTWQALEKIFVKNNFKIIDIKVLSLGPLTAAFSQMDYIIPKFLRPFCYYINLYLDNIILKLKKNFKHRYVLGYLFVCKK